MFSRGLSVRTCNFEARTASNIGKTYPVVLELGGTSGGNVLNKHMFYFQGERETRRYHDSLPYSGRCGSLRKIQAAILKTPVNDPRCVDFEEREKPFTIVYIFRHFCGPILANGDEFGDEVSVAVVPSTPAIPSPTPS